MMQEIEGSLLGLLLYSVMITLFSAVRSQAFAQDAGRFFQIMWRGLSWLVGGILGVGRSVAGISIYISHPIVSKILYGILEWGTAILLTSGITVVLVWIFYEGVKAYGECFGDWISAVIWIASGAVVFCQVLFPEKSVGIPFFQQVIFPAFSGHYASLRMRACSIR